jgi:hypothetical protein
MNLLVLPAPAEELLGYVVATCFAKIHTRLNHKSVSMPYLASLRQVGLFEFQELSPHVPISESQRTNDTLLLSLLLRLKLSAEFPGLTQQATQAADKKAHTLYTKDTCWEFHRLLIKLLDSFQQAVQGLSNSRGKPVEPEPGSFEFLQHLRDALRYGYALQRIVQGSGISHHLKNLTPLLHDHRRQEPPKLDHEGRGGHLDLTSPEVQNEDQDMDLLEIRVGTIRKNGQPQSVWKSYLDWLRLILAHFNAVEILVSFVRGPYNHSKIISIKILTSPNVGGRKLPWKDVLNNPKFFPTGPKKSNKDILEFLSNGISSHPETMRAAVTQFQSAFREFTNPASNTLSSPKELLPLVEKLKSAKDSGARWKEYIDLICSDVRKLQQFPSDAECINRINEAANLLLDDTLTFKTLRDMDSQKFSGSLHCEATLASLFMSQPLSSSDDNSLHPLEVIYIPFILFTVTSQILIHE